MKILLVFLLAISTLPATTVQIRVAHANARSQPASNAAIVAVLDRGAELLVVDDVPYWYRVALDNGSNAYVAKSVCRVVTEEEGENTEEEAGQPISELYAVPPLGPLVNLPNCTETTLELDQDVCPAGGTPGGRHESANRLKNRVVSRCSFRAMTVEQVRRLKGLPSDVRALPAKDPRRVYLKALESRPVVVEGFIGMVKRGGSESTNCGSSTRKDLHIDMTAVSTDPKSNRDEHVVVEVTPWFSETFTGWTSAALGQFASYRGGYSGTNHGTPTKARIYGWLYFDNPHASDGSVGTWRGTAWEVHPVTRIEVLDGGEWRVIQ